MSTTPVATDFSQFARLRAAAGRDEPGALRAAAQQFEALFTQEMLKSMRAASLGEDLLGGEQGEFYQDLFDQQMALHLSAGKGLGIAGQLIQQMQRGNAAAPAFSSREDFQRQLLPHAQKAAEALGVSPQTLIAQAALETGWGQKMIQTSSGAPSFNFFGIKADKAWSGGRAEQGTTEYVDGQPRQERAAFRAYRSVAEAFDDYVRFLKTQPRYEQALGQADDAGFVQGLQKAGYATDPAYAQKILRVAQTLV